MVPLILLSLSLSFLILRRFKPFHSQVLQIFWASAGLLLVLGMTLSPSKREALVHYQILPVSLWLSELNRPQSPRFYWPGWHDTGGNILMTVPLATALAVTWSKRRTIMAVCGLSVSIEIAQHFYGHGRTTQISDVVMNTMGGVIGVGIAASAKVIARKLPSARQTKTHKLDKICVK